MRKLLNIGNPNGDDDGAQFARFRSAAKRARSREDARPRPIGKSASSHGNAVRARVKLISPGIVVI